MRMKNGISAIVAIVLMVLIVVAGVGIVWGVILPFLNTDIKLSENAVSISTEGGYTLYDEESGIACVQVVRNDEEIDGMKILFVLGGNSHTTTIEKGDLPEPNGKKRYCIDLSEYVVKPTSVSVFAIKDGEAGEASSANIPTGSFAPGVLDSIRSGGGGGSGGGVRYTDDSTDNPANVVPNLLASGVLYSGLSKNNIDSDDEFAKGYMRLEGDEVDTTRCFEYQVTYPWNEEKSAVDSSRDWEGNAFSPVPYFYTLLDDDSCGVMDCHIFQDGDEKFYIYETLAGCEKTLS